MSVLMLALGFYMVGVATMLVVRPTFMFRESGTWKEFGLANTATYTVFPFWMFTIVWAVLSYCLAMLCMVFFVSRISPVIAPTNSITNATPTIAQPVSAVVAPTVPAIPAATVAARNATIGEAAGRVPGYYVLEEGRRGALPKYVYYGAEPPAGL
jgi:ammonia channel protein AmtB